MLINPLTPKPFFQADQNLASENVGGLAAKKK